MEPKDEVVALVGILRRTEKSWISFGSRGGKFYIVFKDGSERYFKTASELELIIEERKNK